jgi:hypothetical protein
LGSELGGGWTLAGDGLEFAGVVKSSEVCDRYGMVIGAYWLADR